MINLGIVRGPGQVTGPGHVILREKGKDSRFRSQKPIRPNLFCYVFLLFLVYPKNLRFYRHRVFKINVIQRLISPVYVCATCALHIHFYLQFLGVLIVKRVYWFIFLFFLLGLTANPFPMSQVY